MGVVIVTCGCGHSYLWVWMSGHQALQLQRVALPDGVHALGVALLLHVARMAGVHDTHCGRRCGVTGTQLTHRRCGDVETRITYVVGT